MISPALCHVCSRVSRGFVSLREAQKISGGEEVVAGLICWEPCRPRPKLLSQIWAQQVEEVGWFPYNVQVHW